MCLYPNYIKKHGWYMPVPCGKCIECAIQKSNEWAFRISLEAQNYKENCLITLTYNEDNCPQGNRLVKRDLQLFLKRLRKKFEPDKIRFFACGEYGSLNGRPHYHIILFNFYPKDVYYFFTDNKGSKMYRSPDIEKLWTKGFSTVGEVNYDSAKYVAIYMQKKPLDGRPAPFIQMSRRPGIGFYAINKKYIPSDKIYVNGKYVKIPRYFLDKLAVDFPEQVARLKENRVKNCENYVKKHSSCSFADVEYKKKLKKFEKIEKTFGKRLTDEFYYDNIILSKKRNHAD